MSAAQIHPEELLDRVRQGSLASDEQPLLQAHLADCSACRLELSLVPALYVHMKLTSQDDALIARAVAKTGLARVQERRSPVRKAIPTATAVIASLLVGAAMASAGAYAWRQHSLGQISHKPVASLPAAARSIETKSPPSQPSLSPAMPAAPPQRLSKPAELPGTRLAVVQANRCAERFKRANELRRDGAPEDAVRLYQALRRECAGTSEELLSRVLLGRILLDRLSAPARALAAFDSYLTARSNGALREDAMIGRALALGRLNRPVQETRAWSALLSAYPDSLYARHARSRLDRAR